MDAPNNNNRTWIAFGLVGICEIAYVALTLLAPIPPPDPKQTFHLSHWQTVALQLSIVVPYLVAWLAGTSGALGFERCGDLIPEKDGSHGFRRIGHGITMLVTGSIVSAIIGATRPFVAGNAALIAAIAVATNYVYVVSSVFAFVFLFRGTKDLVKGTGTSAHERDDRIMAGILGVIIAGLYIPLVFSNPTRQVSTDPTSPATYFLPDAVILVTIVIPFLVAWIAGFLSALRLARYAPSGKVQSEKRSVNRLINGLWTTLFASIFLQILVSIGTGRLLALGLGPILALIYVFIILQITGFIMISLGSRRMCRVAEIPDKEEPRLSSPIL